MGWGAAAGGQEIHSSKIHTQHFQFPGTNLSRLGTQRFCLFLSGSACAANFRHGFEQKGGVERKVRNSTYVPRGARALNKYIRMYIIKILIVALWVLGGRV